MVFLLYALRLEENPFFKYQNTPILDRTGLYCMTSCTSRKLRRLQPPASGVPEKLMHIMVIVHPFHNLLQDFVEEGWDQLLFHALQSLFIAIFLYAKKKLAYLPEAKYQTPKIPKVSLSSRTNLLEGEIA